MSEMLLIYVTCPSIDEAKKIGRNLMNKRLCACVNIFPDTLPMFFWPPKSGKIDESKEVVLFIKTIESKYQEIEDEIHKIHSDNTPCIFSIPVTHVTPRYLKWLKGEIE
ncbi:hypothetical protein A2690_03750 [Candidatus Roizmanbacteria bacterium RIFCSPHIGHO2_01_FULL_39_12b]|uniref:Cation tolerance protein CutA n=1 Tax=Candidatus Roizmanbacteria bacterium RIFCSPHIGHO2_01_FULL_39_12b TaxID=1802030 RepID=A0A1F7GC94_9BACT|nr:MAG: hypothetical protein A2690_03750 [Candidatus Roizmanbacteria bacterium RIFCSPHIGHO2_01_FULL_39_12b]OGK47055.1 MAG: hypothetical protein A3B46_01475 [Candidatus Roizmanbacteria bacterium RIFCSPLOWO2_01_FULL_39_19]